jgi:4-amino-4-deoxy-L-arabinose transferase-like glycosyltransferase
MLPVPWLCWATAKRLAAAADRHRRLTENQLSAIGLAAAIVPLTIPNLIRVGASVTNDSLLISASSFFLYFLVRIATGDLSRRTVTGAAVFCAVALLTKGFALILPPILIAALFMGIRRKRRDGLPVTGLPVITAITIGAFVVGSLWWLRNIAVYGHVQTNGFGPGANDLHYGPADHSGQLYKFIPNFLVQFFQRTWGGFALADAPAASPLAIWGWITVIAIGLLAALGAALRQLRSVTVARGRCTRCIPVSACRAPKVAISITW